MGKGTTKHTIYSRPLMAQTSLGLWKFILEMVISSHRGLIIAPGEEANGHNLGMYFQSQ